MRRSEDDGNEEGGKANTGESRRSEGGKTGTVAERK